MYEAMRRYGTRPVRSPVPDQTPGFRAEGLAGAKLWTGALELEWTVDSNHPVVVGTGNLDLWQPEAREAQRRDAATYAPPSGALSGMGRRGRVPPGRFAESPRLPPKEVVEGIVLLGENPLLPGSSLKGAVRQAFELLTPSCDPTNNDRCKVKENGGRIRLCPACHLFGVSSFGGRVDLRDARWLGPGKSGRPKGLGKEMVPRAWRPREHAAEMGTYRVYELRKDRHTSSDHPRCGQLRDETVPVMTAHGLFSSRILLQGLSAEELGIFLLSLGLGAPSPGLRLGGKRFQGLGALDVELVQAEEWSPEMGLQAVPDSSLWAEELTRQALGDPRRDEQWRALHRIWGQTEPAVEVGP